MCRTMWIKIPVSKTVSLKSTPSFLLPAPLFLINTKRINISRPPPPIFLFLTLFVQTMSHWEILSTFFYFLGHFRLAIRPLFFPFLISSFYNQSFFFFLFLPTYFKANSSRDIFTSQNLITMKQCRVRTW